MKIEDSSFSEEYTRICNAMKIIETNKDSWPYTSNSDWLWLDGRRAAMQWIMKMAEN